MSGAGGGSAYIRLEKPDNAISQGLQYWGGLKAKDNAAKKLADEREGIRKKKEVKDWENKYNLKSGDFKNKYTGFKSFDDMNTDFSMYATDQYVQLQRQAREALESGDIKKKSALEGEMIRMKNMFDEVSKSQDFFGTKFGDYQKAVQEGRVSGASKEYEDIVQEAILNKNLAIRIDEAGNLVYTGLKNGEDGSQEPFNIPFQDMMDGSFSWFEKQQISGKGGLVDNVLNDLGTITKESTNGYYKLSEQAWDDAIHGEASGKAIDAMLGNDEVMGDLLYQFTNESSPNGKVSKMRDFTEEERKLVKDNLQQQIRAGYSEKFGKDFNSGKYSADTRPRPKQKANKKDQDLGARKYNINQVRDNKDVSFFTDGDFKWNGKEYEAQSASMVGDEVVIKTNKGKVVKVNKNNEVAMNDLFNAFEGTKTKFDQVQTADEFAWRAPRKGSRSAITDILAGQYNSKGIFVGEETPFVDQLQKIYPQASIGEATWFENAIEVNGETINLDDLSKQQVEDKITKALGVNNSGARTEFKATTDKKGR